MDTNKPVRKNIPAAKIIKRLKWILIWIAAIFIYRQIGILYEYEFHYAIFYQTSTAAKILTPFPPIMKKICPFNSQTLEVSTEKSEKYGSFKNYYYQEKTTFEELIWPVKFILLLVMLIALWIGQLFVWLWALLVLCWTWLFSGELLQWLGVIKV